MPHDSVVGICTPTSNGLNQLYEHAIPHLGSKGLVRELDTQAFCKCTVSLFIWGNVSYSLSHFVSLCQCISILLVRSFSLQVSPSLSRRVPRSPVLCLTLSMHLHLTLPLVLSASLSFSLATCSSLSCSLSLPQCISMHPHRTLPLVSSPSLSLSLATCPSLSCSLSHSLNASPSYSSARSLCKSLLLSGYMFLARSLSLILSA